MSQFLFLIQRLGNFASFLFPGRKCGKSVGFHNFHFDFIFVLQFPQNHQIQPNSTIFFFIFPEFPPQILPRFFRREIFPSHAFPVGKFPSLFTMCDFHNFSLVFTGQCTVCQKRLKSTLVEFFLNGAAPLRGQWSEKKFQTTLILVFEVIVQPPKAHYLTFSSETKIMKITHVVLFSTKSKIIRFFIKISFVKI